jgi:pimeloyl-ACP methyl ester carboxylesterase
VSDSVARITWFPLGGKDWPDHLWLGSDTVIDDHRLFARVTKDGDDDRPPLLMLHGAVVSGAYFGPIARRLDETRRMFIPDLAGFGRSGSTRLLSVEEHVDLLDRWMDVHGLRQAGIVANSTGCQVATLLAIKYPDRVSRMVLVAPTMDPATGGLFGLMMRGLIDIPRERQRLWTIWVPDFFASGPVRAIHAVLVALRDPQGARLGKIRQPTFCVAGERDPICPPAWVESMARQMPAGSSIVLRGAPHAMNFSAPDALARVIMTMMDNTVSNEFR